MDVHSLLLSGLFGGPIALPRCHTFITAHDLFIELTTLFISFVIAFVVTVLSFNLVAQLSRFQTTTIHTHSPIFTLLFSLPLLDFIKSGRFQPAILKIDKVAIAKHLSHIWHIVLVAMMQNVVVVFILAKHFELVIFLNPRCI